MVLLFCSLFCERIYPLLLTRQPFSCNLPRRNQQIRKWKNRIGLCMRFAVKIVISLSIIIFCTQIGRKFPTLAGLIAVMPLTGLIVLLWLYSDSSGDFSLMTNYTKGALWGIIPSILFFLAVFICFRRQLALWIVLSISFTVWTIGAIIHQWLLNK